MSRLSDALKAFSKTYHEAAPVRDGACHDASEMDAWPMKRYGKNEIGSGGYRVLDSEGGDSRRGAGGPGYPVDKSDPEDPMEPGWRGPALDDEDEDGGATGDDDENTSGLPGGATSEDEAREEGGMVDMTGE